MLPLLLAVTYRWVVVQSELWAVNCNWNADNRYWNVNANPVTNPNEWNADNQVFSRDSRFFLPCLRVGKF